jgi:hypothetical protein
VGTSIAFLVRLDIGQELGGPGSPPRLDRLWGLPSYRRGDNWSHRQDGHLTTCTVEVKNVCRYTTDGFCTL